MLAFISLFLNMSLASIQLLINVIILENYKENLKYVLSLSFGVYGLGSILGPLIVSVFGIYSLGICGIYCILQSIFYLYVIKVKN